MGLQSVKAVSFVRSIRASKIDNPPLVKFDLDFILLCDTIIADEDMIRNMYLNDTA